MKIVKQLCDDKSKEWEEFRLQFERFFKYLDTKREKGENLPKGVWYCNGQTNEVFKAYLHGYNSGVCECNSEYRELLQSIK